MALNYLLYRHQVSLIRAREALSREAQIAHQRLADMYAQRIRAASDRLGGVPLVAAKSH